MPLIQPKFNELAPGGRELAYAGGAPGEEPWPGPALGAVHHVARPPRCLRPPLPGGQPAVAGRRPQGQETLHRLNSGGYLLD